MNPSSKHHLTSSHQQVHPLNGHVNYLFDLSYLALLRLNGEKALDFLQGQITSDARKLSDSHMIPAALCNLKGRILTLMHAISWHGLHLLLPTNLLKKTQESLEKPALLSRVKLLEQRQFKIYGFYLQNPKDIVPVHSNFPPEVYAQITAPDHCYFHLGKGFYIFLSLEVFAKDLSKPFIENNQFLDSTAWHRLRLMHRQIEIYPQTRGLFLPHKLDLHHSAYLAFDKGCYKGQEIIARMHYRATIHHELKLFTLTPDESIFLGQKLLVNNKEIGDLVDFAYLGDKKYLIAVSILKEAPEQVLLEGHQAPLALKAYEYSLGGV